MQRRRYNSAESELYHAGGPVESLFVVRRGAIKTRRLSADGVERIDGLALPGELVGADALDMTSHPKTALCAVARTEVCEIPFHLLETLSSELPTLRHELLSQLSQNLFRAQEMQRLLASRSAEPRVAQFLLELYHRWGAGGPDTERTMALPLRRQEIAGHLGIATETLSRTIHGFQERGWLAVRGRLVTLKREASLRELAEDSAAQTGAARPRARQSVH
ncbi:MAG: helix-turn-helix domain-containing protein [Ectothiorhodospiraceae bacterium]